MAIRKVLLYPNSILTHECDDIEDFSSEEFKGLIEDMLDTLAFYRAKGLAASQIGVLKRVFVILIDNKPCFFVNPKIVRESSITAVHKEGCLSFPEVYEYIKRPKNITIKAQSTEGEEFEATLSDMDAAAAFHEYDHLFGVLFIDRVSILTRKFMLKKLKKTKKKFGYT